MSRELKFRAWDGEDVKFLISLQEELKTQEIDSQAAPRFWVIRQFEKKVTNSDFADGQLIVVNDNGEYSEFDDEGDINDFIDFMTEYYADEWETIKDNSSFESMSDLIEIIEAEGLDDFTIYPYKKVSVIKENTMFLTKQEAKDHIEANYYHYNKSAHTYAMTAWRARKVERLMKILETADFSFLLNKED